MPAGAAVLGGFALAAVSIDRIAGGAGGTSNPEHLPIEGPAAGLEVQGCLVNSIDPGLVLGGLDTGLLERSGDGLAVDQGGYTCVGHDRFPLLWLWLGRF